MGERRRRGAAADMSGAAPLPELLDAKRLQRELGITRAAAETIMRQLPVVIFDDLRKVYVRRSDVLALVESRTFAKSDVMPRQVLR
jgi:hypothetical protein